MKEELGISTDIEFLYSYAHSNSYETELVYTYSCIYDGTVSFNTEEIDEVRPWGIDEIMENMDGTVLSDNFKHEITTYMEKVQL
jgi:hypothetical protein